MCQPFPQDCGKLYRFFVHIISVSYCGKHRYEYSKRICFSILSWPHIFRRQRTSGWDKLLFIMTQHVCVVGQPEATCFAAVFYIYLHLVGHELRATIRVLNPEGMEAEALLVPHKINNFRAISRNGYTRSVWSQNTPHEPSRY